MAGRDGNELILAARANASNPRWLLAFRSIAVGVGIGIGIDCAATSTTYPRAFDSDSDPDGGKDTLAYRDQFGRFATALILFNCLFISLLRV